MRPPVTFGKAPRLLVPAVLGIVLALAVSVEVWAQKGRSYSSGGGSSFSTGRSSAGGGFSTPSSRGGGTSFGGGSSTSGSRGGGISFGSGGSSTSSSRGGGGIIVGGGSSSTSSSRGGGGIIVGGGTTRTSPGRGTGISYGKPSLPFDIGAATAQKHVESQRRYEQRDRSSGGGVVILPTPPGKNYSSGTPSGTTPRGRDYSSTGGPSLPPPRAPPGAPYDQNAAEAQRREESRKKYEQGTAPRPTYPDPQGKPRPVDPNDRGVVIIRQPSGWDWWIQRERRQWDFSRRMPVPPPSTPVIVYTDPYSTLFWTWILQQSLETRATWAFNHHNKMDPARYRDFLAKDDKLKPRIDEFEKSGAMPDPGFVPAGIDPDLMYTDDYVDAVTNPSRRGRSRISTTFASALGRIFLVLLVLAVLYWLIFVKRWGETPAQPRVAKQGHIRDRHR
jgi:hypothetical protein